MYCVVVKNPEMDVTSIDREVTEGIILNEVRQLSKGELEFVLT